MKNQNTFFPAERSTGKNSHAEMSGSRESEPIKSLLRKYVLQAFKDASEND